MNHRLDSSVRTHTYTAQQSLKWQARQIVLVNSRVLFGSHERNKKAASAHNNNAPAPYNVIEISMA